MLMWMSAGKEFGGCDEEEADIEVRRRKEEDFAADDLRLGLFRQARAKHVHWLT